jgi:hypothetical protein
VMREAMVASALESAARAEEIGMPGEPDHSLVQGVRRAGSDRHLSRAVAPL